ncbi:class I SAM-dependent methyltransferase [Massilia scottii]|uniref:class I SAM-dependent methyltransferase n=1 Tax=Massilia scottii TaxID=3057166 RepID=UPI0027967768|nr:class I SAM-dependent methyltransferase [Massilia sp. CCM 9029]MDQ1830518.1 class I SAM-dependent methyltransferase [Massilia sp. CCM 9029]
MSAVLSQIPPPRLRFMGESDTSFMPVAEQLSATVLEQVGGRDVDLLDIGCGYGRLAYGLRQAGFGGSYRGLDILREHIAWLKEHFAAPDDGARFGFDFINVHNSRYNPGGLPLADVALPYAENSFDCVTAFSVFTHMEEDDVRTYLRRIRPLVRENGLWIATFFSLPDGFSLATQNPQMRYRLREQVSEHAFVHDPAEPLHVIAYREAFLRTLFAQEGWELEAHKGGSWLGDPAKGEFQDRFALRKRAAPVALAVAAPQPEPAAAPPSCNICGNQAFVPGPSGRMASSGAAPCCARCGALERHRVVRQIFLGMPIGYLDWRRGLQFSPDPAQHTAWYRSYEVSVYGGSGSLDIQAIDRPDDSYDFITLSHVLECIPDDLTAFDELQRVLAPRGLLHIGFGGAQGRALSEDFEADIDQYGNRHRYGRDVYQRFGCAAKGMGMLAVQGTDPATGVHDVAWLFVNHAPDVALLRGFLLAWDPALTILEQALP